MSDTRARNRLLFMSLFMPCVFSTLGGNGASLLQLFAVDGVGVSPEALGGALGLGVVSVPLQLLAARFPARHTFRILKVGLVLLGACLAVVAASVVAGPQRGFAGPALLTAVVVAELITSCLYVPAWQPIVARSLDVGARAWVSGWGWSGGCLLKIAAVTSVGALLDAGHARLAAGALVACLFAALALAIGFLRTVERCPQAREPDARSATIGAAAELPTSLVIAASGLLMLASWPLFLVYARTHLVPEGNLGVWAALQTAGSVVAGLCWPRLARMRLLGVCAAASGGLVVAGLALALRPGVLGLAVMVVGSAMASWVHLALLETLHRQTRHASSVRVFTVADVVSSSSMQVGQLLAGWLIVRSGAATFGPVRFDGYLAATVGAAAVLAVFFGWRLVARTMVSGAGPSARRQRSIA
ncbi:MAG: hypothetical protein JNK82_26860 [Myxococcaceae bacterium]|nr:hypothetical protein [Myxococcaceae bacterium]